MQGMAAQPENGKEKEPAKAEASFATLKRFLPYLWPKDMPALRIRIVIAMLLVLVSKGVGLSMGWLLGLAVDQMAPNSPSSTIIILSLVAAYAGARFSTVLFDNLRNVIVSSASDRMRRAAWPKMSLLISTVYRCVFI
jgi:ABC-type multidrug transport system fused ATPase/permease subunit